MDTVRYELKTLNRQFSLYAKTRVSLANNLIALLDQSFPGVNRWFDSPARKDGSQKWVDRVEIQRISKSLRDRHGSNQRFEARRLAATFWHAECVASISCAAFTERYRKWCKRHGYNFNTDKAAKIHAESRKIVSLVSKTETTKLLVQEAAAQLLAVSRTVETIRAEMLRLASKLPEFDTVMSMYGVGESTGPQLMAEIGDIRRFAGKQLLVAFAGVDPMPNQSGSHESRSCRSSKRGSPYLRKTLFVIMTILLQNAPAGEPVFQFLDRKRAEGKPYYVYMTAGANKFLRRYYGKVRDCFAAMDSPPPRLRTQWVRRSLRDRHGSN